jgi:hypothetical protein
MERSPLVRVLGSRHLIAGVSSAVLPENVRAGSAERRGVLGDLGSAAALPCRQGARTHADVAAHMPNGQLASWQNEEQAEMKIAASMPSLSIATTISSP